MRIRISSNENWIEAYDTQDNRRVFWRSQLSTGFMPYPGNINGDPDPNDAITFTDDKGEVLQLRFLENNRILRTNLLNGDNMDSLFTSLDEVINFLTPITSIP